MKATFRSGLYSCLVAANHNYAVLPSIQLQLFNVSLGNLIIIAIVI